MHTGKNIYGSVSLRFDRAPGMPRITLSINDRDHLALKILSLQRNRKLIALIQDAIGQYLESEGAYSLEIKTNKQASEPGSQN